MKILRLFRALILAVALLLGGAGSIFAQEEAEVTGVIAEITKSTVTIAPKGGGTEIILDLAEVKEIIKDGVTVGIDALAKGDRVEVVYDPKTMQAHSITAESPPRGSFGTANTISIGADGRGSFVLETKGGAVNVVVTPDTKYHIPTRIHPWQTWEELEVVLESGDRVAILFTEAAAEHIAQRIMVLPHSPVTDHSAGVIIEVADNSITIENKEGNTFTFNLPEDFPEAKVGELVTIISKRAHGIINPVAKGQVAVDKVYERLNRQIEGIARRVAEGDIDEDEGGKDIERLKELLKANYERHRAVLERVSKKFEARFAEDHPARLAIERAKNKADTGYEKAVEAIEKGKGESKPKGAAPAKGKGKPEGERPQSP